MKKANAILALLVAAVLFPETDAAEVTSPLQTPNRVQAVLTKYCADCHGDGAAEGSVRFDEMEKLNLAARLELLNKTQDQLFFKMMPPEEEAQPSVAERSLLAGWIRSELQKHNASKLDAKLRYPDYGNYLDHETLFSGEVNAQAFTPARRWLVSPQIFHERVMDVFQLTGRERERYKARSFYGVTNPFVLPERSGVRYYDLGALDGGRLLVMLANAEWISKKQVRAARVKSGEIAANEYPDAKDRWAPRTTPDGFEAVILKKTSPTDAELIIAIQTQFDCVLQRPATDEELSKYLQLTRSAIELAGNTDGIRKMLVAVLLESEFLYRLEFGAGEADQYGRRMLSAREASYAISYALGDRTPDLELTKTAAEGRLNTQEDYKREVLRLLDDKNYYRGQVDPSLNGKHFQSNVTSHPRIVRFFREFFGYPGALKVFKDTKRSGGYYRNPGRGSTQTPGFLVLEADRIVDWYLQQDQDVFENLLTTEQFFVYHNKDNATGRKVIDEWKRTYAKLKDTAWKTEPEKVLAENLEFLQSQPTLRIREVKQTRDLLLHMYFFEESFGKGRTPFTTIPWAHGYTFHHAPFYGLPATPSIGRYHQVVSKKFKGLDNKEFWDYPVEQPFKIDNRKGLLTHPAWLIAHSQNTATDPVRRGRWIREKLLAGLVPDVPITVDAQIPEDAHKTLRERLDLVTAKQECWKCHRYMNPLGLAFEMYDDFGRYRAEESLEHPDSLIRPSRGNEADIYKTKQVVTTGRLDGVGDPLLDGEVEDALDMIDRLAKSKRVRQSIIRHAFRFYLGRNEMLSDSQTLIDADHAYVESGGSFKAVVASLLTSESFMYRKDAGNQP